MGDFFILPRAFVEYVEEFKRIPIPEGVQLESLQAMVEVVCLEAALGGLKVMHCPAPNTTPE